MFLFIPSCDSVDLNAKHNLLCNQNTNNIQEKMQTILFNYKEAWNTQDSYFEISLLYDCRLLIKTDE